jgi:hypothetical protein
MWRRARSRRIHVIGLTRRLLTGFVYGKAEPMGNAIIT